MRTIKLKNIEIDIRSDGVLLNSWWIKKVDEKNLEKITQIIRGWFSNDNNFPQPTNNE